MASHYPTIFVSYGGPDADRVAPLIRRLKAFGFVVREYKSDMAPGDDIIKKVKGWIAESRVAVICFTADTAQREWLTTEVGWCNWAEKKMIPIRLSGTQHPDLLKNYNIVDIKPGENGLLDIAWLLVDELGLDAPQVLPAAIFAMTDADAANVLVEGVTVQNRKIDEYSQELCAVLGMEDPPKLFIRLLWRYGATAEELRPFQSTDPKAKPASLTDTVVELAYKKLEQVNNERRTSKPPRRPLFIRWLQDEFTSGDPARIMEAGLLWESSESLLIVDSISTWSATVRQGLDQVPHFTRSSVMWIPPYTQQTGGLDAPMNRALVLTMRIAVEFRNTEASPTREVSREATTPTTLSRWLLRMLHSVPDTPAPRPDLINDFEKALSAPNLSPANFNG